MCDRFQNFKGQIEASLEPIKEMILYKQALLPREEWINFLNRTRISIINSPEQFLAVNVPDRQWLIKVINEIFREFRNNY